MQRLELMEKGHHELEECAYRKDPLSLIDSKIVMSNCLGALSLGLSWFEMNDYHEGFGICRNIAPVLALASASSQLIGCVQKIRSCWKNFHYRPKETVTQAAVNLATAAIPLASLYYAYQAYTYGNSCTMETTPPSSLGTFKSGWAKEDFNKKWPEFQRCAEGMNWKDFSSEKGKLFEAVSDLFKTTFTATRQDRITKVERQPNCYGDNCWRRIHTTSSYSANAVPVALEPRDLGVEQIPICERSTLIKDRGLGGTLLGALSIMAPSRTLEEFKKHGLKLPLSEGGPTIQDYFKKIANAYHPDKASSENKVCGPAIVEAFSLLREDSRGTPIPSA